MRYSYLYPASTAATIPKYLTVNSSKDDVANYIIAFVSLVLNLYLSVGSTLYVFWMPLRRDPANRIREESHITGGIQLELVNRERQPSLY